MVSSKNNKLEGKRLLVLGGASVHCKVVEAARELGVYTIVADYLIDSPAKRIADETLLISILDVDEIINWCKKNPVDGIINYSNDPVQRAHQKICEELGLPSYGTKEQMELFADKLKFKEACIEYGIPVIPSFDESEVLSDDFDFHSNTLLIKPTDSRGSRGQMICNNKEEVIEGIQFAKEASFTGNIIIEKYMGGYEDIQFVYLVIDGNPVLVKVEDRYVGPNDEGMDRLCVVTVCPSRHDEYFRSEAAQWNQKIKELLIGVGIKNAPIFLQGFWDGENLLMYDPGIRFPGDEFDRAYTELTGVSLPHIMVEYALTGMFDKQLSKRLEEAKLKGVISMVLPCLKPGTITTISGLNNILRNPKIVSASIEHREGDVIEQCYSLGQRFAEFVLVTESYSEMKEVIEWIESNLKVLDEKGNNMVIDIIKTEELNRYLQLGYN